MRRTPYKATAIEARPKQGHDATSRQMSKRTTVDKIKLDGPARMWRVERVDQDGLRGTSESND